MHHSIATIDSPEFINLPPLDINPLMSSCDIKVLYIGQNRNHSYITKEVATNMAKTLRGAPIVGYYKEEKGDFADHGEKIIIDDEGIKFQCMTVPYGFVSPDAKVWFQTFNDIDDFGNEVKREYLVTTGYLWTGQYEECKKALDGRPHSMELDNDSLEGKWSTDNSTGMDFFIVNDATFSKLCILGDDVEPCFEGSSITSPATTFSKVDNNFKHTLFSMMEDLKFALKGGNEQVIQEDTMVEQTIEDNTENLDSSNESIVNKNDSSIEEPTAEPIESPETEFEKNQDEKDKDEQNKDDNKDSDSEYSCNGKDDEDKKKYSLLEAEYNELKTKFDLLQAKCEELEKVTTSYEREKKEELINKFYMLDDEDKKDVKDNIDKYSLDDIESKLSVICVRKRVSFANEAEEDQPATTFSLEGLDAEDDTPEWIKAVLDYKNNK